MAEQKVESANKECFLGVDIGSRNLKIVALTPNGERILKRYRPYLGNREETVRELYEEIDKELESKGFGVKSVASTGTGWDIAKKLGIDKHLTEINANLIAARTFYPHAKSIIEIGGTDSKYVDSVTGASRMNVRCSSSTGASLENIASELNMDISEFASCAVKSVSPTTIDATCAVFARANAITQIQSGKKLEDVARGYINAMVDNYLNMCPAPSTPIVFQGGVAMNKAVEKAFIQKLGLKDDEFIVADEPIFMVAVGAAQYAMQKYFQSVDQEDKKSSFPKTAIPLSAKKKMIRTFSDKGDGKPIVWLGNIVPPEIFLSLGYRPMWPGLAATRYVGDIQTGNYLRSASMQGFTEECCNLQRLLIGLEKSGVINRPALMVSASQFCDFEKDSFKHMAKESNTPLLELEVPTSGEYDDRVKYVASQFKKMHEETAHLTGKPIDLDALAESISWSAKTIDKIGDIQELRARKGAPRVSSDMFGFTFNLPILRGCSDTYDVVNLLHDYFSKNQDKKFGNGPRILWDLLKDAKGKVMDYVNDSLVLESVNFVWPKDFPQHGIFNIMKSSDPYEQLARITLSNAAIRSEDRLVGMQIAKEQYDLDGVIMYQHTHCPLTRDYFSKEFEKKLGIPILSLSHDVVTGSLDSLTKSRLDSFIEYCARKSS